MRNERIAPQGILDSEWEFLFLEYPGRFMIGVDTFSTGRWQNFEEHTREARHWMDQLPPDIARRIGLQNAIHLFFPADSKGTPE